MASFRLNSFVNGMRAGVSSRGAGLVRDRGGNFGIITALLMPVLLGAGGAALDLANLMMTKSAMQGVSDAASLAVSASMADKGISEADARKLARDWVAGMARQVTGSGDAKIATDVKITTKTRTDGGKTFDVRVTTSYDAQLSPFMRVLGKDKASLTASAETQSQTSIKNAMSMYFVLDKSGSMQNSTNGVKSLLSACNRYYMPNTSSIINLGRMIPCMYTQMEALQNSAAKLFETFDANDKDKKYIRVGAVSYNASAQSPSPLTFARETPGNYVKALAPEGGTNSTQAFEKAYESLVDPADDAAHKNKSGLVPKKYIVFMTDGTNSSSSDDTKTKALCRKAKDAKITVYTVAFNAPLSAKLFLMDCASSPLTYFDAVDASALSLAFETIGKNTSGLAPRVTR